MKILLVLLLFFSYQNVFAKTIITPYLKVGEVSSNYQVTALEKIEKVTYYKQEKIDKEYKYLEVPNDDYQLKSNDIIYGKYTPFTRVKRNNKALDEDIKTIYYYNDIKKIDSVKIKNVDNLLITNITLKYKDKILYQGKKYNINLNKEYTPEYLTLEITCFLNQEDRNGTFKIENENYIKDEFKVTKKGYSKINIKLINHLTKIIYDNKVLKTTNLNNKFYIKVLRKENLYRYRKKYYKCYKNEVIIDTKINNGYKVIDTINKYYLYRKEKIEVFDNISIIDYLDLSKIIKSSTIALSKLNFYYDNNCSDTNLIIKYKDFEEQLNITFNCKEYQKSKVRKGKTKSLKRKIVSILFKTIFLRKM